MVAPQTAPAAEVPIDAALVRALVDTQMPEASHFELGDRYEGWDCVTWRLGEEWAVRLPRSQKAADLQITELAWLPRICRDWPFRVPVPVRVGQPSEIFPWRWSIVNWIDGRARVNPLRRGMRFIVQGCCWNSASSVCRQIARRPHASASCRRWSTRWRIHVAAGCLD